MATGIPSDDISTSDISDIVRTKEQNDEAGDWDKEDLEPSHEGRSTTGSKNGKGKGDLRTMFDGNREAAEEPEKSINGMGSHFEDEVSVSSDHNLPLQKKDKERILASLEVRKKNRRAASPRERAAERKSSKSLSLSPRLNNSSLKSESRKGKWTLSGNGRMKSEPDLLHDASTGNINSKSSSRRIRSEERNMKSPPAPLGEKVKLKLSSQRKSRRSPGRQSRRERKAIGLVPSSFEPPLQSAEIIISPHSTPPAHSLESAHSRDPTDDDLNANADAHDCDAVIEEVANDHDRQQKTETAFSQPNESADASLKSKSARIPSNDMKSPPTPSDEKVKLKWSSPRKSRRSPVRHSRRERKSAGMAPSSLEPPLQSAEIIILSHSTQSEHLLESAHSRDPTDDDLNANADAPKRDAGIEEVANDHDRQQKTGTAFSQPNESPDASFKSKSARTPSNDLSKFLSEYQFPTPEIALDGSSMPSLAVSTLQAEAVEIGAKSFGKQHIAKIAGGLTKINNSHYSTKNGGRDEELSGLISIASSDSSIFEDSSYAIDELLPVDSAPEAGGHPVVEQDSLKSSAKRNGERSTYPQHETDRIRNGRPTVGETLANGKKNALNLSAHSEDSSMRESFKMEEGTIVMVPVLQKSRWLPAVEEEHDTTQSTEGGRKETKSAKDNGLPRHISRSAKADTHSDTDDDVIKVATSFAEAISDDSLHTSPSQEEDEATNEKSSSRAQGRAGSRPVDTRPTGLFLGTKLREDKSELVSPHVNTTAECYESETESLDDDTDEKGIRRDRRPIDSDVHALQDMPVNYFNSPSIVGGPGPPQVDYSLGGRSAELLDRNKGLQQSSSHRRMLRQKVNSRREVLTSMLQATSKKTHSTENELLDLKRKLALSQALVQELEVDNAQIRRQAVIDVARVQMVVQTKRHNHATELESRIKELIIERSAAVQESHELRMIIMDSCAACQSRLPDREFEMDDSIRRTIMGRGSGRQSSTFEWLAGNLAEEAQDIEEASTAASRTLNSKGRRFHDESDTYSLTSTLPDTGSMATSNLPTFGEAPLHWLSSKILKKGGKEKNDISESDPPMIERVITYNTLSADANGGVYKSPSSVHDHGKDSENSVETSDAGDASSIDPQLLASASVPTKRCTNDSRSVEGHLAADEKTGDSFASNGSVSGEQASESKHVFGLAPQPAKKTKEKRTAGKSRFAFFGSLMAEQVADDISRLPNAAVVNEILRDMPENDISKYSDNGKGGKTASGSNVGRKGSTGLANYGGKVGSTGIKSGAVQRVTLAPWRPVLGDSMGSLALGDSMGSLS